MNNQRDTFLELRGKFDGQDPFMTGGHQIIKMRTGDRVVPEWTKSDKEVQKILLRSFPKLRTSPKQRALAGRWAQAIHLYYRMQMTRGQVAAQMKMNLNATKMLIRSINWAGKGLKANGKGPLTGAPRHRPRKRVTPPEPPVKIALKDKG